MRPRISTNVSTMKRFLNSDELNRSTCPHSLYFVRTSLAVKVSISFTLTWCHWYRRKYAQCNMNVWKSWFHWIDDFKSSGLSAVVEMCSKYIERCLVPCVSFCRWFSIFAYLNGQSNKIVQSDKYTFFYRQLDFSSEPGVAVYGPGLHRKLRGEFLQVKRRRLSLLIIVVVYDGGSALVKLSSIFPIPLP